MADGISPFLSCCSDRSQRASVASFEIIFLKLSNFLKNYFKF